MHGDEISRERRHFLRFLAASALLVAVPSSSWAQEQRHITVWKDPNCGCCGGWVEHLRRNGFVATVIETSEVQAIKTERHVPTELTSCHTAEISGYTIEGHVPADAIRRLLSETPAGRGLAVPGMPIGSPGMEGGKPEVYDVILFGDNLTKLFARFLGERPV